MDSSISYNAGLFNPSSVPLSTSHECLKAPIRCGKTHRACEWALETSRETGKPALYVVRSHEQCRHVAEIIDRLGGRVIHAAGRRWRDYDYKLQDPHSLTPAKLYKSSRESDFDVVKLVEYTSCNIVVTVPELAVRFDPTMFSALVLDEETTVSWFFPRPQLVCEWRRVPRRGCFQYENKVEALVTNLDDFDPSDPLGEIYKVQRPFFEELKKVIDEYPARVKELKARGARHPEREALSEAVMRANQIEKRINFPPLAIGCAEKTKPISFPRDELYDAFELLVTSMLPVRFEGRNLRGGAKLWMIPDCDAQMLFFKEWLRKFQRIMLVLDSESAIDHSFFSCLGVEYSCRHESEFPYRRNFIQFDGSQGRWKEAVECLIAKNIPILFITGRKQDASDAKERLPSMFPELKGGIEVITDHSVEDVRELYHQGKSCIVYLNSAVSKGVDLPFFDVAVILNYDFATFAAERGTHRSIVAKEVAQTVLRISPTPHFGRDHIKYVIWACEPLSLPHLPSPVKMPRRLQNVWIAASVERSDMRGDLRQIANLSYTSHVDEAIYNLVYMTKPMQKPDRLKALLFLHAPNESRKPYILQCDLVSLMAFISDVAGECLCSSDVLEVARRHGLVDRSGIYAILEALEQMGCARRVRQGRRVIWKFEPFDCLHCVLSREGDGT